MSQVFLSLIKITGEVGLEPEISARHRTGADTLPTEPWASVKDKNIHDLIVLSLWSSVKNHIHISFSKLLGRTRISMFGQEMLSRIFTSFWESLDCPRLSLRDTSCLFLFLLSSSPRSPKGLNWHRLSSGAEQRLYLLTSQFSVNLLK